MVLCDTVDLKDLYINFLISSFIHDFKQSKVCETKYKFQFVAPIFDLSSDKQYVSVCSYFQKLFFMEVVKCRKNYIILQLGIFYVINGIIALETIQWQTVQK